MHLLRDGDGAQAGARLPARLKTRLGTRGIALAGTEELLVDPWPPGASEGRTVVLEVVRAAWRERGRERLARARPTKMPAAAATTLQASMQGRGLSLQAGWPDDVAEQWHDGFEQAVLGQWRFAGGALQLAPTPAFLAVDVDGTAPDLATPALNALARAIRLWGLGGGIVVDLPGMGTRDARAAAALAFDRAMAGLAFERTGINGFGLMQIVRPRPGPSILERARLDRPGTEAIRLLDMALRDAGTGPLRLRAQAAVIRWLRNRPHLLEETHRRARRTLDLVVDPLLEAGHVETRHP